MDTWKYGANELRKINVELPRGFQEGDSLCRRCYVATKEVSFETNRDKVDVKRKILSLFLRKMSSCQECLCASALKLDALKTPVILECIKQSLSEA